MIESDDAKIDRERDDIAKALWSWVVENPPHTKDMPSNLLGKKIGFGRYLPRTRAVLLFGNDAFLGEGMWQELERIIIDRMDDAKKALKLKIDVDSIVFREKLTADAATAEYWAARGPMKYKDRHDKSIRAKQFLEDNYARELSEGTLTLSDLRLRDKSLWAGLRNWASAGDHDLDAVIPRGRTQPGPAPQDIAVDDIGLDPNDERDALAIKGLRQMQAARQRARRLRAQRQSPK